MRSIPWLSALHYCSHHCLSAPTREVQCSRSRRKQHYEWQWVAEMHPDFRFPFSGQHISEPVRKLEKFSESTCHLWTTQLLKTDILGQNKNVPEFYSFDTGVKLHFSIIKALCYSNEWKKGKIWSFEAWAISSIPISFPCSLRWCLTCKFWVFFWTGKMTTLLH